MLADEEIKVAHTYSSHRWGGTRKVVDLARHRVHGSWVTVVHYIDQRTSRTGTATLEAFAKRASLVVDLTPAESPC